MASGTFENSSTLKSIYFAKKKVRYVRLVSVTEAHGYNDSAIAELQVLQAVAKKKKKKKTKKSALLATAHSASGKPAASAASGGTGASPTAKSPRITAEIIGGKKFLTLTFRKPSVPDGKKRTVQVSPDLLDWFSGRKHTTVLIDNDRMLRVRDNVPMLPGRKRFIRLETTP
ncbi:MAG: hypothetical protein EOP85_11305 [Verrucomicrobiaceae bacterium]|nr:MAG: hypothetical protein EOP85_11305 [Verrucomicrobiaceae bacterium]